LTEEKSKMAKTCEEIYVSKVEAGIRGIRLGSKTPNEAQVGLWLNKLKTVNDGLYDDLFQKYKNVLKDYEKRKNIIW
jgi:hypothetical protein